MVEEFFNIWKTLDICSIPPGGGYTSLVALVEERQVNLTGRILIAKGMLKPLSQLHTREIVQEQLSVDDIYVRESGVSMFSYC